MPFDRTAMSIKPYVFAGLHIEDGVAVPRFLRIIKAEDGFFPAHEMKGNIVAITKPGKVSSIYAALSQRQHGETSMLRSVVHLRGRKSQSDLSGGVQTHPKDKWTLPTPRRRLRP